MTPLEQAAERWRTAAGEMTDATNLLHIEIRKASEGGESLRSIAKETRLSFQRIHQIVNAK